MLVPFDSLESTSRIWVYQSERPLSPSEQDFIINSLSPFIQSWESHGNPLKGSAIIKHNQFIIIACDEFQINASGCAIDKSVHIIKELSDALKINLIDRKIAWLSEGKVHTVEMNKIKQLVSEGFIPEETLIFNNLLQNIDELNSKWLIPAGSSWLTKYYHTHPIDNPV